MHYSGSALVYAPTDLSRWLSSPYASWMARYAAECPEQAPASDEADDMLDLLAQRGLAHEEALEREFADSGLTVVNVMERVQARKPATAEEAREAALALTRELLIEGVDVVAQAMLERGAFRGYADFLVKVEGCSELGDFHYEVWDTKLARRVRPGMVLQLCCYADMLDAIQGHRAEHLVVALGNGVKERIPLIDCFDYYKAVKRTFQAEQDAWRVDAEPDPARYNDHGNWSTYAADKLEQCDHLSRVARISRRQIERLESVGIRTMSALADSAERYVPGIEASSMAWLVQQAGLQRDSRDSEVPEYRLLESLPDSSTGLNALPAASPLDVFFDIEGFPLEGDGLEYLWGCACQDDSGGVEFRDWWAHDTRAERLAFEGFIDWVHQRWLEDPCMHIYHYAPYEITACKRLMGTHGTRESELDDLLRNEVFVDLYDIVTHGLQVGEPRYSIKNVERLYRPGRATDVASGGDSVVVYDLWRDAFSRGEESADWRESDVLAGIRSYNRDDCESTLELCQWLRRHQQTPVETQVSEPPIEPELSDVVQARVELRDRLLMQASDETMDAASRSVLETLAGVLEFHRREEKNAWWRFFDRMDPANTSLADDLACLADCRRTPREPLKPTPRARNLAYEFSFDPNQESRGISGEVTLKGGELIDDRHPTGKVLLEYSDLESGRIVVQCKHEPVDMVSLVPNEIVRADPIPAAIDAVVGSLESGLAERSALQDFLERRRPRIQNHDGGPIVRSEQTRLDDTVDAVRRLEQSCLVIQGPPGAGKSYTGARVIGALLAQGKRVGISSNSHSAINNLLIGTARYCREAGIAAKFVCTRHTSDELDELDIAVSSNARLASELSDACVIGTTAWGFARDDMADSLDVLVIDEAGQVAVANLVGMSRSARNLVLMGDQRQLGQPTQGSHPAESGLSVLDYRLGDTAAVAPEHGVFLGTTYRMHPAVNALVSRYVYAGQLVNAELTARRTLGLKGDGCVLDQEAGIVYLPVMHEGNAQDSAEEVDVIIMAVKSLVGRPLRCDDGSERILSLADMLFVAPYNAQVTRLQQALGDRARVGSVDRFQGQEAPVVFLSLCSSDAAASPRGPSFLFDRNRLNVAVSRAETLCVVVGHPRLAVTPVGNLADLKRVNFVAALMNS
ncbi:TM0106 family RecB-like putative nuclease [Granulosicoccus sp. 3-233]|uniref:TM0106 family RecB-like putative nuclease n=1 Tax=Granulosicoccus sp. 3-233 TaxID=3417969 RepID=UPI003D33EEF2